MLNIKNYKLTPEQLAEIESHLQLAGHILNSEDVPNWEDLNTACRQISDAMQNLNKYSGGISLFVIYASRQRRLIVKSKRSMRVRRKAE